MNFWIGQKKNPGQFTYPKPPDFTGSAFIRQAFYEITGGYEQYTEKFDSDLFESKSAELWDYLNKLEKYLWRNGETYPSDLAALDTLFERGEVSFNMTFTQTGASGKIAQGRYPETVKTTVFKNASLANTHFTAIPFNSPNKAGALTAINTLLSPEIQLSKNKPENWGDFTVLDFSMLPEEDKENFAKLDLGAATLPLEILNKMQFPKYHRNILKLWKKAGRRMFFKNKYHKKNRAGMIHFRTILPAMILAVTAALSGGLYSISQADSLFSLFSDKYINESIIFSLQTAFASTLISAVSGTAAALLIWSLYREKKAAAVIYIIPLIVPHILAAFFCSGFFFLREDFFHHYFFKIGAIDSASEFPLIVFDQAGIGIILGYFYKESAFITIVVLASLKKLAPEQLKSALMLSKNRTAALEK